MEYPLNEQNQYPLIRKCVERVFVSRAKQLSEKTINLWVEEIMMRNFTSDAVEQATNEFIENEEYSLSLPVILKLIKSKTTFGIENNINCVYCGGSGIVGLTLAFDLSGTLINTQPYALKCYCNKNNKLKLLQMTTDNKSFNKTYSTDKYFRVFKDVLTKEKYLKKVYSNGNKDILQ